MFDLFSGGALQHFAIGALGIMPYISASIIMQLLTPVVPSLEKLQREGEVGRGKINQYTRYLTIVICLVQGAMAAVAMTNPTRLGLPAPTLPLVSNAGVGFIIMSMIILTAGTMVLVWLGERITENGIGNGVSLLIFVGIIASFPGEVFTGIQSVIAKPVTAWFIPLVIVGVLLIIVGIVFVDSGVRRVPVQYAKRMVGRKMYGGQSTHIPMKVNSSGVMPLIFAISVIQLPGMIANFWPTSGFALWYGKWFSASSWLYMVVYALLILFFTYFYTSITFNPVEMSKNLQQNGGFIPGIRPGKPTADYLARISNRITLFGALYLALIAVIPSAILVLTGSHAPFTATGILIVVSVAMETSSQLEAQMMMRHYKGFMK